MHNTGLFGYIEHYLYPQVRHNLRKERKLEVYKNIIDRCCIWNSFIVAYMECLRN